MPWLATISLVSFSSPGLIFTRPMTACLRPPPIVRRVSSGARTAGAAAAPHRPGVPVTRLASAAAWTSGRPRGATEIGGEDALTLRV